MNSLNNKLFSDSVDKISEEDDNDPYVELSRTPPHQILAKNRKWSADKKHGREMEKRCTIFPAWSILLLTKFAIIIQIA